MLEPHSEKKIKSFEVIVYHILVRKTHFAPLVHNILFRHSIRKVPTVRPAGAKQLLYAYYGEKSIRFMGVKLVR